MLNKAILDLSLGDGYISKPKTENANCLLRMHHSIKQKEYVHFKMNYLRENGIECIFRERIDKGFHVCYAMTGRSSEIKRVREVLYKNGKKTLCPELIELFDERTIAFLFQDDGHKAVIKKDKMKLKSGIIYYEVHPYIHQFCISTNDFDKESLSLLLEKLLVYGVEARIYDRKGPTVCISKKESKKNFIYLVKPYMCSSMMYKIEDNYYSHGRI
ncbi:MAG: hypothetical protein KGZ39_00340 [Simkania sp.]|nr:hypothetical protein [Simkania sp.]